jgi:2-polyprenyl-3-methyl-5-hydroxy-6-metoxy-1,4-benzoquinol methylase
VSDHVAECLCGFQASQKFTIREYQFYKCPECTLIFVSPRFDATSIYDSDYFEGGTHGFGFSNYESDKLASTGYLFKYLKWLDKLPSKRPKKLLDIGAANGFFISLANQEGFDASGLEISSQAVEWATKLQRPVEVGTIETSSFNNQFNFVTALDVLEHIEKPREFLQAVHIALVPEGYLLINVPYVASLTAKISGKKWHAFLPPEHWFYFNRKSLRNLLESLGFEVIHQRAMSKSFSVSYIYLTILNSPQFPHYSKTFLSKFKWITKSKIGKIKVYLPLFDNLSMIAVKRSQ